MAGVIAVYPIAIDVRIAMTLDIAHEYFTWELVQEVAAENGYFQEEGVDAEIEYFAPGTQDFSDQGANAYETDWWEELDEQGSTHGVCEWNAIQEASETGRKIVGSYSEWDRVLFTAATSSIEHLDDLKGKPIGINNYATSFYSVRELLQNEGFTNEDIVLEHVGSAEERFDAVKAGEVDAIGVLEPFVTLGRFDDELREVFEGPCRAALVAPPETNQESVDAFRRALNKAVDEINDNLEVYTDRYIELLEGAAEADPDAFEDVNFDRLQQEFELRHFLPVRAPDEERITNTTEWLASEGYVDDPDSVKTAESVELSPTN